MRELSTDGTSEGGQLFESVRQTVEEFGLISPGDRILVAFSGGKDSVVLLHVLEFLRREKDSSFSLLAVHVDEGFAGNGRAGAVREHLASSGVEHHVQNTSIARLLEEKLGPEENRCPLCSRLRRGALYKLAPELGCNKIALGHQLEDLIETLLLNLFFSGQLKSMPPLLRSDDGRNTVIRPLACVPEAEVAAYAEEHGLPVIVSGCLHFESRADNQRLEIKRMLERLEKEHPGSKRSALEALKNVVPGKLLDLAYLQGPKKSG